MSLIEIMSLSLSLPMPYLEGIGHGASHRYKRFSVPKRGKGGGYRIIYQPAKTLKALQRWLLHLYINDWPVHECVMSYRYKIGIVDNARSHQDSRYLLRMDIENFFPSITRDDIIRFASVQEPTWDIEDLGFFASLVCRQSSLVIGAPSSPGLSNAICRGLDEAVFQAARDREAVYTRYADDMFFSTTEPDVLREFEGVVTDIVESLDLPSNLKINAGKTRHSSKKGRRRVTGITLSSDGTISVGRPLKRQVRSLIFKRNQLSPRERKRLAGYIAFIKGVDPDFVNSLILKYGPDAVREARFPDH